MMRVIDFVARLISATALFSCSVTKAVLESALIAAYSGSRSWATDDPGP